MNQQIKYSPVVITVYSRLYTFINCIESLKRNSLAQYTDLFVISDAPYVPEHKLIVEEVRNYARLITGFKNVHLIFRDINMGSHLSGYDGICQALKENDTFIFLEDDIVVSDNFLQYMNDGLRFYKDDPRVYSICGFCAPFTIPLNYKNDIWFSPISSPWGYATWKKKWEDVDYSYFDRYNELKRNKELKQFLSVGFYIKGILQADSKGYIEAGDLRAYYHMFKHNMCSVFPVKSKTQNWGFDGSGEHCGKKNVWWAKPELDKYGEYTRFIPFEGYNKPLLNNYRKFQDAINGGIFAKYLKYTWIHELYKKLKNQ